MNYSNPPELSNVSPIFSRIFRPRRCGCHRSQDAFRWLSADVWRDCLVNILSRPPACWCCCVKLSIFDCQVYSYPPTTHSTDIPIDRCTWSAQQRRKFCNIINTQLVLLLLFFVVLFFFIIEQIYLHPSDTALGYCCYCWCSIFIRSLGCMGHCTSNRR